MFFERFIPHGVGICVPHLDFNPCDFRMIRNLEHMVPRCIAGLVGAAGDIASHLVFNDPYRNIAEGAREALNFFNHCGKRRPYFGHRGRRGGYGNYFDGPGGSGSDYESSGFGAPLGPGETVQAKKLFDYFLSKGLSTAQSAGILGNIQTESNFRTNAYNPNEGAIGLCQWEGGRRTALESFAANMGKAVTDWTVQADFVMHELNGSEKAAYASLKRAQTPQQAAKVFQSQYERSYALTNRAINAATIHKQFT